MVGAKRVRCNNNDAVADDDACDDDDDDDDDDDTDDDVIDNDDDDYDDDDVNDDCDDRRWWCVPRSPTFDSLAPGISECDSKNGIYNLVYWLVSSDLLMIIPSDECHRTLLMLSQHWFK